MERPTTTFNMDFQIAEAFGENAIRDTYKRAKAEWKNDCGYFTELVVVLNERCWMWHSKGNEKLSSLYSELYYDANDYALDNYKGEEAQHFLDVTD